MKQPINNDKIIPMSRVASYFFVFSKLSISLILFLIIIVMSYALIRSYQGVDLSSENTNEQIILLSEKIFLNNQNLSDISRRLELEDKKINEIKKILLNKENNNINLKYETQISELLKLNKQLKKEFELIKKNINLKNKNTKLNKTNLNVDNYKIKNLKSIYVIALLKFKNGENIQEEIEIMEDLSDPQKKMIFEKLSLIKFDKFFGLENLYKEFEKSTNRMIKNNFLQENQSNILKFIFNFISISPNNLNKYENEDLNILMAAKKSMEEEDIENALNQILRIKNYDKFFNEWIDQSKKYLEYKLILKKVI